MSDARPATIVSFNDPSDETWLDCGGLHFNAVFLGPSNDPTSPVAIVVRGDRDVGDRVAGLRTHSSPCTTAVMQGDIQLDGRWMRKGDLQVAPAGIAHGDLVFGPEGAVFVIMFNERVGIVPEFAAAADQQRFDATLRQAVEAVATGRIEAPVEFLPARDTHTPRRALKVLDRDEVHSLKGNGHSPA